MDAKATKKTIAMANTTRIHSPDTFVMSVGGMSLFSWLKSGSPDQFLKDTSRSSTILQSIGLALATINEDLLRKASQSDAQTVNVTHKCDDAPYNLSWIF